MSTAVYASAGSASPAHGILSVECELTGRCQQRCLHCCTDSGPTARTGTMTHEDWVKVIHSIRELGILGVQFIGGEPTLYPRLIELMAYARSLGLAVEVYSNLIHVRPALWEALSQEGVRLATSYYSDDAAEHDQITGGRGTHARIRSNIAVALGREIPLRVGIVRVLGEQRVEDAEAELRALGVKRIQVDGERKVGRAAERLSAIPSIDELCGHCFHHRVAISPDGEVYGCILSRFLPTGNVKEQPLQTVLTGRRWAEARRMVPVATGRGCTPDDSGDCDPANTEACDPAYGLWA
ncbi:radical SAM/SPASM domain-containing protein [Streptomyces sp. NPDC001663]|uniref:radical SAM/SPASM domain-containing protein n=1 Tax=Streptomyces sp. NPDC001663 TaxID=3364597 RepID=UPI0036C32BC6